MRYLSIVLSLLFVPAIAVAQGKLTPRPLDPIAAETFAHAVAGSAVVRALVEQLEVSNVIVHIVTVPQMPAGIGGTTRFVTSRGGYRYLRITLGANMPLRFRSGILGHELKHACEVADSSATDVEEHARAVRERRPSRRSSTSRPARRSRLSGMCCWSCGRDGPYLARGKRYRPSQ